MRTIALCADEASLKEPGLLGLEGENLESQPWLSLHIEAQEARRWFAEHQACREAWVVGCDGVAPINLAAALKADRPEAKVRLCCAEDGGSVRSRVNAAGLDALLTPATFVREYERVKLQNRQDAAHGLESPGRELVPIEVIRSQDLLSGEHEASAARRPRQHKVADETPSPLGGLLLPVVSGGGGVGKSTVAALSALLAQRCGYNTLLLDADLQFGDMHTLLGVEHPVRLDGALEDPSELDRVKSQADIPALLAAPARLEVADQLADQLPQVLDWALSHFDVVIANTGDAWGEQQAILLERAPKTLFLIGQSASSLRACKSVLALCARCGIATGSFAFALNGCSKAGRISVMDASFALQGAQTLELAFGGREVDDFVDAGCIADLVDANNALCNSLYAVLSGIIPEFDERASRAGLKTKSRKQPRRKGGLRGRRKKAIA